LRWRGASFHPNPALSGLARLAALGSQAAHAVVRVCVISVCGGML